MLPLPKDLRPSLIVALVLALSTAALGLSASALADEEMRRDMLARDHDQCLLGCLANNNGAVCKQLCGCTIEAFEKLAFEDYVRLNIEMSSGRVSETHNKMLTGIAQACAAEVDRKFPELAVPDDEESGEKSGEEGGE